MACDAVQFGGQILTEWNNMLIASSGQKVCFPILIIQAADYSEYFVHMYQSTDPHIQEESNIKSHTRWMPETQSHYFITQFLFYER
jgi:hypothetical protein